MRFRIRLRFAAAGFGPGLLVAPWWGPAMAAPAQAQVLADAGTGHAAPKEATPADPDPRAAEVPPETGAPPAARSPFFPKALRAPHRLPENLQGWLNDRRASAAALEPRTAPSSAAGEEARPSFPEPQPPALAAPVGRRVQAIQQGGVTVLSNRMSKTPPPLARPAPRAEPETPAPEEADVDLDELEPNSTATRSLRARSPRPRRAPEQGGPAWPLAGFGAAVLGLAAFWYRKRNRAANTRS